MKVYEGTRRYDFFVESPHEGYHGGIYEQYVDDVIWFMCVCWELCWYIEFDINWFYANSHIYWVTLRLEDAELCYILYVSYFVENHGYYFAVALYSKCEVYLVVVDCFGRVWWVVLYCMCIVFCWDQECYFVVVLYSTCEVYLVECIYLFWVRHIILLLCCIINVMFIL